MGVRSKLSPVDLRLAYPLGATLRSSGTRKVWLKVRLGAQPIAAASAAMARGRFSMALAGSTGSCRAYIGQLPTYFEGMEQKREKTPQKPLQQRNPTDVEEIR